MEEIGELKEVVWDHLYTYLSKKESCSPELSHMNFHTIKQQHNDFLMA